MLGVVFVIFLLDMKGWVFIWRDYWGDVFVFQVECVFVKLMDGEVWIFFVELQEVVC